MKCLPEELIQLIYEFEGNQFFKSCFKSCLSFIDVKSHPELTQDLVKEPGDIIPYNMLRTNHYNYIIRYGLKRKIIQPKNGIEVLNRAWVEQNKERITEYMAM
jgi:hypothetical protein